MREAVFSSLETLFGSLDGLRVVDLYAGSGALGLEAVSRGAHSAVLVDRAAACATAMRATVRQFGVDQAVRVEVADATAWVERAGLDPVDLVLLDPPYDVADHEVPRVLGALLATGLLQPRSVVVVEVSRRTFRGGAFIATLPADLEVFQQRKYGDTIVLYAQLRLDEEPADGDQEGQS